MARRATCNYYRKGCPEPHYARGLCEKHYRRALRRERRKAERGDLLTGAKAARYLGLASHASIWQYVKSGQLLPAGSYGGGGYPLYDKVDLDKLKGES